MFYRSDITLGIIQLTVLTSVAHDPFCRLLAGELQVLCKRIFFVAPAPTTAVRESANRNFLLPQALEMLNTLITSADKYPDHRELAFELRQIKRRVILKHTSTFKEMRAIVSRIVSLTPNSNGQDE